ncbi:PilZ domain-containing protein [Dyella sp. KRB-257]|uniref:PilZ domain-containing protein n=1 Tax=Dyella sp. KRB-257 TaxID=3400915 RepID=UPI003C126AB5
MTDALWLAFSERVCVDDRLRVAVLPRDAASTPLAQLAERNASALAGIAATEERRAEGAEEDSPVLQELARLDAKLNALVDIVNRLLLPASALPERVPVRFNAVGALLPAALLPVAGAPGQAISLRIHLDACPGLPLELPARVSRRFDDGLAFVVFEPLGEAAADAIERFVFRHHRRKVAEARQSLT